MDIITLDSNQNRTFTRSTGCCRMRLFLVRYLLISPLHHHVVSHYQCSTMSLLALVYMKLPVYSNSHQDQTKSMTSPNLLALEIPTAYAATASGRTPDRDIVEMQQVRVAKRHQAAIQGLKDSAWREASMRLSPSELAKTKALVDQDAERCQARQIFTRTQSRKARK
ncbi:hypothetical protein EDD85DRAFT_843841 [Armillaria nabsnona]|nr:hypothetical protein EDD85DRAFT_843841 [Armillaria nabsnona]